MISACAHCRAPIDGPPAVRDGLRMHPACLPSYTPPRPRPVTEFVSRRDRMDPWGGRNELERIAARYRPAAPVAPPAPPTPRHVIPPRGGTARTRMTPLGPDADHYRPLPGHDRVWIARDGRAENRNPRDPLFRYVYSDLPSRPGYIRFQDPDSYRRRDHARSDLVRAAWGEEASDDYLSALMGGVPS